MRKKYEDELRNAVKQKCNPSTILKAGRRGRLFLLGPIDLMVQNYKSSQRETHAKYVFSQCFTHWEKVMCSAQANCSCYHHKQIVLVIIPSNLDVFYKKILEKI